jgi:hypothetical protein
MAAHDPHDPTGERRLIASVKSNLGIPPRTLSYSLVPVAGTDVARVAWGESSDITANEILRAEQDEERGALGEAVKFLLDFLKGGTQFVEEVETAAAEHGIANRTLRLAREELGIAKDKEKGVPHGRWFWSLANDEAAA